MVSEVHEPFRKYQIFLSSSYKDLERERKALIEQILAAGHIPSGMELFSAGNQEDFEVIKRAIDQADIFVVIVGSCFGSVIEDGRSYTQMEFQYALEAQKPILAFLMEEGQFLAERNATEATDEERQHELRLGDFREEVKRLDQGRRQRIVAFFGNEYDGVGGLKARFQTALDQLVLHPECRMSGWVRGTEYESARLPPEVAQNEFIRDIVRKLSTYNVLSRRCTENPLLKSSMAEYFWAQYFARITNMGTRQLFFESGSTVAYLSSAFSNWLSTPAGQQHLQDWKITTNNVLTYLDFVLSKSVWTELVPYGPPEERYGATFGDIALLPESPPPTKPETLEPEEKKATEAMARLLKKLGLQLVLAATSGLELTPDSQFRGPHIGSYYNKLFKRAILSAGIPTVIFLDETKILKPFKVGYCHSVCDADMPFEQVCESLPLALCIGCGSAETREEMIEKIAPLGFEHVDPAREYSGCCPLMAKNQLFQEFIGRHA